MGGGPTNIQATDTQGATNDEVQQILVWVDNATGGVFRLVFGGEATTARDYDATAAELDNALESFAGIDEVTVSGSAGGPWTVTFVGDYSDQNVAALVGELSLCALARPLGRGAPGIDSPRARAGKAKCGRGQAGSSRHETPDRSDFRTVTAGVDR